MLKLSPSLLQPGVYLQHQDAPCLSNIRPLGLVNYAIVSLKAAIPTTSGHDHVLGPTGLTPQLCMAAGPVTDLLNPRIKVVNVLREVNLPWV